jgi:neutral ceramidase
VLIGLANEYIGYTASEAEFAAQDYEGASTMYGARQGKAIGDMLAGVAREQRTSASVPAAVFHPGAKAPFRFGPEFFGERYNLPYANLEPVLPDAQHRPDDSAPRFEWSEPADADWSTRDRRVTILRETAGGWEAVDDDRGVNILTVLVSGGPERRWSAVWIPPKPFDRGAHYMFRVEHPGRECSREFQIGGPVSTIPMPAVESGRCVVGGYGAPGPYQAREARPPRRRHALETK